jgi:hypothetical protein
MPFRNRDLRTLMLRASPTMYAGDAARALAQHDNPAEWLLIYQQGGGYVVLSLADLAARLPAESGLLSRSLGQISPTASPAVDAETDPEAARALLARTGYVMVLRDDAPWGVLEREPLALTSPAIDDLLARVKSWVKPGVLADESTPKTPEPPPQLEAVPTRTDRYVNNDFAAADSPSQPLDKKTALRPGQWYYLRVNVGELEETSIDATPAALPDVVLQEDVDIRVVVFSERFTIERDTGVLRVPTSGPASVLEPAALPPGLDTSAGLAHERLLFRLQAPAAVGLADLRVNMYCKGMLIQSRLIAARVGPGRPLTDSGAQRVAVLDFNLSPTLAPSHLADVAPHKLSLMVNTDSAGTHAFRVFGQEGNEVFASSATMSPTELGALIKSVRNPLQLAAWGAAGDWDGKAPYRYDPPSSAQNNWRADVINLALKGFQLYSNRIRPLAGGNRGVDKLRPLMRTPGMVQLANKVSANDVVPIALFYDYDLDTQTGQNITICPQFEASLASGRPLIDEPCFKGDCPNREGHPTVVCPSGFWGFRHDIGMPWAPSYGPEMAKTIAYTGTPTLGIGYYEFPNLGDHLKHLAGLGFTTQQQTNRDQTFAMLKSAGAQLVYFYCHGVVIAPTADTPRPALRLGNPNTGDFIETDNLDAYHIRWDDVRPLVMINGCHTTQLSPEQALSFVSAFVEVAEAAGVIGTEITIFEPLAQAFAEAFLKAFRDGEPFGRAIRMARLELLAKCNPLGLVYQPFAYAGLKLVPAGA